MNSAVRTAPAPISITTMPSPIGVLTIAASDAGLRFVMWEVDARSMPSPSESEAESERARIGSQREAILQTATTQLDEYFRGERTDFDVPLDPQGTPFQQSAWAALRAIPYGSTVTYGHQARMLGDVRKSRAVGAANGKNPIGIVVPCHRVVGADGSLTGFAGGLAAKAWLLDHEQAVNAR